ncbi:MAG: secondary thiamine-phosphate synthase enzyme YjbQ [Christensenellales bacterium]|jgi:secondary thiamine-phosphate synthase enzyme
MVYREAVKLQSNHGVPTFHDVTQAAKDIVSRSGIKNGIVVVYSHHTTCSVITQERAFDLSMTGLETLQQDFIEVLQQFIPDQRKEGMYLHPGEKALKFAAEHDEDARGCHNTDAHLRSALIGRSESIALIDGELDLGQFGFIYFIDFDQTRARVRTAQITVLGD